MNMTTQTWREKLEYALTHMFTIKDVQELVAQELRAAVEAGRRLREAIEVEAKKDNPNATHGPLFDALAAYDSALTGLAGDDGGQARLDE